MLSKSQAGLIKSLHQKKFRKENNLFIAEGIKTISEFISSGYVIDTVLYTPHAAPKLLNFSQKVKLQEITSQELAKISTLSAPQDVLALIHIPHQTPIEPESLTGTFTLALDGIQDPGNLGTIIRTADWFGFSRILCSADTVEAYNPKVVQATMGSLARVSIHYTDLKAVVEKVAVPVYGALLDGKSVYQTTFGSDGLILLGNEGNGITDAVSLHITHPITIPRFGGAESLNVGIAGAIICSEVRRKS